MKDPQREVEELRAGVNCATVLEKATPAWLLDRKESSKRCLKYRRAASEIVIVTHGGAGWWDPNSDAKGDVFRLVQHLEPSLNFGEVRKRLRPLAGVRPDFTPAERARDKRGPPIPVAQRWAGRPRLRRCSDAWRYLGSRGLPHSVLTAAARCDVIREGPRGSAWFAHRDPAGLVIHVDVRGPTYKGSLTGGRKSLFCFSHRPASAPRAARARRGGDRRLEPGGDRAPARGHDLRGDRRRHGPEHDRRARGAPARSEGFAGRAPRERCRRQSCWRSLRRSAPGDRR